MRASRVLGEPARSINFYHCMSRTLRELQFWDDVEKEYLRELLTKLLAFSGLEMLFVWRKFTIRDQLRTDAIAEVFRCPDRHDSSGDLRG